MILSFVGYAYPIFTNDKLLMQRLSFGVNITILEESSKRMGTKVQCILFEISIVFNFKVGTFWKLMQFMSI